MRSDRLVGVLLLFFALIYGNAINAIELDPWSLDEAMTARTLPTLLAIALAVLGLMLLLVPESKDSVQSLSGAAAWRIFLHLLLLIGFAALLPWVGFYLVTAIYLAFAAILEGVRNLRTLLFLSIGAPLLTWLLVVELLGQTLEKGRWLDPFV